MPVITAITPQQRRRGRFSIFLDDEFFLGVDEEVLHKTRLKVGMTVERPALESLIEDEDYSRAKIYLARLFAKQMYTTRQIRDKLKLKGYSEKNSDRLIAEFTRWKYLDDPQYARHYVESRLKTRPVGINYLKNQLTKRGIDKELIKEVLSSYQDKDRELESALQALTKKKDYASEKDLQKRKRKMMAFLAQKGFPPETIFEAIRRKLGRNKIEITSENDSI